MRCCFGVLILVCCSPPRRRREQEIEEFARGKYGAEYHMMDKSVFWVGGIPLTKTRTKGKGVC